MKALNFVRYAFITAAVGLFATSSDAAWTYTETEVVNGTGKGSITDGVWTFYAERAKNSKNLSVKANQGSSTATEPCVIDFTTIGGDEIDGVEGEYKVVSFHQFSSQHGEYQSANRGSMLYSKRGLVSKFIAPCCTQISGEGCFKGCTNLIEVSLGESVKIGSGRAFENCTSLRTFNTRDIDGDNKHGMLIATFMNCSSLEGTLNFSECVSFGQDVFNGCAKLGGIKAENAISVGQSSFAGCASLSNIVLSSNIEKIDLSAFSGTAISAESATKILSASVTSIGKYNSGDDSYKGGCFSGCTAMFGELVWKMPNLATNVVPSECFKNAVLGKIVFKTPIDTFESAAFYNVRAKDNAATELHLHEQVPAQIKNNAFMRHDPPYTKVYIPDNYENWLDVIEEDKNHILIRKADFQNRGWTQNKHSSVGGWDGITKIMANDTSMCKKDGSGNSAVFEVFDKHVIGFAFVYGSSGGGCWILKKPETGFKVIVR